jgi:hypothetical protein
MASLTSNCVVEGIEPFAGAVEGPTVLLSMQKHADETQLHGPRSTEKLMRRAHLPGELLEDASKREREKKK